jgi:hypothetical protein
VPVLGGNGVRIGEADHVIHPGHPQ